ncbi:MAG TPA: carboxypeptidase regulatory-like domain-containing protein [Gemmatimonadales bacterium]|nr:carboxypeptidase regulatory-like domain-containing protein [Gemmatimonadales bacterium]
MKTGVGSGAGAVPTDNRTAPVRRAPGSAPWLVLVALVAPLPAVGQVADSAPEPVILELQLGRLAGRTVPAFRVRTEALVPMSQFLELAEIRYRLTPEGRLEARVDPGDRRLVIEFGRDTMVFGDRRVRIEPEFKLVRDGELFIGAERLGDLLGSRLVVSWTDLVVTLVDPADLPIGRRARRGAMRAALLRREEQARPELELAAERPSWGGLVLDYSVLAPSTAPLRGAGYTAGLGADVAGGSLELGVTSVGPAESGVTRLDASWSGVWREHPWLRQLRLGDGSSTGPRGRILRGVAVTNAPFLRPSGVGDVTYRGRLAPGWSVEAYRGGDLVAYDSTGPAGEFAMALPVRYGENPVEFVAYGPRGEIRAFNRTYRVIADLLPGGRFEYGVSGGSCRSPLCSATLNADLRYGLAPGWTVRAGLDGFWRDTLPDRLHPYASVIATPANPWAVEIEGVGRAWVRGGARYEPSLNLRLSAEATAYAGDRAPVLFPSGRRAEWRAEAFWRPAARPGVAFLEARLERVRSAPGTDTRARLGGSFQAGEVRWFPFVRVERRAGASENLETAGLELFMLPRPEFGPVLGAVWARLAAEAGRAGLTRAQAFAARQVGGGLRLEVGAAWVRGASAPTYTLVFTTYLPALRSATAFSIPPTGPAFGTQFLQGSLLWDRATRALTAAPGPSLERAGVAGYVFLDENGDGVRDPGEPGVPNVRVRVGSSTAVSDSNGRYRVWDIVPYEPVVVTVDSQSLASPLLVPAVASASLIPGPNRFRGFDVPLVRAGVIEGRVVRDGRGLGGATLLLTDLRTGGRRTVTTFSDGEFYLLGVKPGDYELTVDPRVLEVLDAVAGPVRFTLAPTAAGVGRSGLVLEIRPRP